MHDFRESEGREEDGKFVVFPAPEGNGVRLAFERYGSITYWDFSSTNDLRDLGTFMHTSADTVDGLYASGEIGSTPDDPLNDEPFFGFNPN